MKLPDFSFEKKLWKKKYEFIAGVDEVGRGCFAGPVVAGCVILNKQISKSTNKQIKIDDSKKLTPRQREIADKWIRKNCLAWGIGEASVGKINKLGMGKAARIAFRQAIRETNKRLRYSILDTRNKQKLGRQISNIKYPSIDYLLADAFFVSYVPGLPARRRKNKKGRFYKKANGRQQAIINGDEKSVSIAAASIIAKVYRDNLMLKLSKRPKYRKYGWGRNKGYGTREHQRAIKKYGITRQHRKQWVDTWLSKAQ